MSWFKRKSKPVAVKDAIPPAPYEQSTYDWEYRIERITEIAEIWGQSLVYTAGRLDKWVIREVSQSIGGDPEIPAFIPTPLWDNEWMFTRSSYPTREQAEAFVNRVGGELSG